MIRSKNIDWYRHLSFAAVGGFFAAYAILLRMGIMANAQTLNLLELLLSSLRCHWLEVLMHLGALAMYVLGTMSTVILPHLFGWDMRRVCPIIDALCAVLLAFLPAEMPVIPSLPYLLRHERAVEFLYRGTGPHQLHHLLHQQHQAGLSLPGTAFVHP